ncbi:MAG: hypothetical protein ABIK28_20280 [Planctomycetota bacterium]
MTATRGPLVACKGKESHVGDVELKRGNTVQGRVVDHENHPVKDAEVRVGTVHSFKEAVVLQPVHFTDEAGAFTQSGIALFSAMAAVRRFPQDRWTLYGPFNPATGVTTITLPPTCNLEISTFDDKEPPLDVTVKTRALNSRDTLIMLQMPVEPKENMERPEPGVILLKGLSPGLYELLLTASGFPVVAFSQQVNEAHESMKVTMAPAVTGRVRVVTKLDHEPVPWAAVYTWTHDEGFFFHPSLVSRSRTDKNGSAVLKRLCEGKYKVTVSHPGNAVAFGKIKVPSEEETVIEVEAGGTLEGVVKQGNTEFAPPYLLIMEPSGGRDNVEAETPRFTVTDLEGKFQVTYLNPGPLRIVVQQRLFDRDALGIIEWVDKRKPLHRYRINVESGRTRKVEITIGSNDQGPSTCITGVVTMDGLPVEGAEVSSWTFGSGKILTDANGFFRLDKVIEDADTLCLNIPRSLFGATISLRRKIVVEENVPLYEGFELITGSLNGHLVEKDSGEPVPGQLELYASMEGEDNPYLVSLKTRTKEDGSFCFEKLPIGVYSVRSNEPQAHINPVSGIKVYPGMEAGPIKLEQWK